MINDKTWQLFRVFVVYKCELAFIFRIVGLASYFNGHCKGVQWVRFGAGGLF